jgi:hypothetical protein
MDKRLIFELGKIEHYKKLVSTLVNEYSRRNPKELSRKEFFNFNAMVERMFENEADFLVRNPEDYYEIYCDDWELPTKNKHPKQSDLSELEQLNRQLAKLIMEKERQLELENYETAAQIRDEEREVMRKIDTLSRQNL